MKKIDKTKIKKILVLRLDHIGDLLFTAPLLKALRSGFPASKIAMLVGEWNEELLRGVTLVDEVICYNAFWIKRSRINFWESIVKLLRLRNAKFDLVISTRGELFERILVYLIGGSYRMGFNFGAGKTFLNRLVDSSMDKHIIDRYLDIARNMGCGIKDKKLLEIHPSNEDIIYAQKIFGVDGNIKESLRVVIAPGAGYASKLWDNKKFSKVINSLIDSYHNAKIVLVGAPHEYDIGEKIFSLCNNKEVVINLVGKTKIMQLAAIIKLSSLLICLDSAPLHFAVALDVPFIALFGPTKVKQWGPYFLNDSRIVITKELECYGCVKPKCRVNKCMQLISEEEVLIAVEKIIERYYIKNHNILTEVYGRK